MSDPLDAWKPWPKCPAEDCEETEDITIMECAPGHTYMTIGGVCGHVVLLHRKPDIDMTEAERQLWEWFFRSANVPRETKET